MLAGKTAIVTGAGRGIGKSTAKLLAREGADIVLNDFDELAAGDVANEISEMGGRSVVCAGDVTASSFPDKLIRTSLDAFGRLDIIVNNAGNAWDGMLHNLTDEQWDSMLAVHVTAPFRILRAAAPFLRQSAKREICEGVQVFRKIVNVSSISGTYGLIGQVNYAAAKAAVIGLTRATAREWGPLNVNCNAVALGFIDTRMTQDITRGETSPDRAPVGIPAHVRENLVSLVPLRRLGTAEEAADAILFLCSSQSDYVTGHVLHVDGGFHM